MLFYSPFPKENTINNNKVLIFFIFGSVMVGVFPFQPFIIYSWLLFACWCSKAAV